MAKRLPPNSTFSTFFYANRLCIVSSTPSRTPSPNAYTGVGGGRDLGISVSAKASSEGESSEFSKFQSIYRVEGKELEIFPSFKASLKGAKYRAYITGGPKASSKGKTRSFSLWTFMFESSSILLKVSRLTVTLDWKFNTPFDRKFYEEQLL